MNFWMFLLLAVLIWILIGYVKIMVMMSTYYPSDNIGERALYVLATLFSAPLIMEDEIKRGMVEFAPEVIDIIEEELDDEV